MLTEDTLKDAIHSVHLEILDLICEQSVSKSLYLIASCVAALILLLWSHFCSEFDQFHIFFEDCMFLLVCIVAELKSNIVSYLPAANSCAAGFLFSSKWMVVWRQVKDCATICLATATAAATTTATATATTTATTATAAVTTAAATATATIR